MNKHLTYPYKIEPATATEFSEKWKNFETIKILAGTNIIRAPKLYPNVAEHIYNFKVRADDVWVITYPRSGTTLTQEMVWMVANDDYETAKAVPLLKRSPYLEFYSHVTYDQIEEAKNRIENKEELKEFNEVMSPQWITLENDPNRRFIKSHLQFPLLPPDLLTSGCKIIYVARNPKDAALSLFKFRAPWATHEDFPEFWNLFQNGCLPNGPYWEHVTQGWNQRVNKNVCFLFYEDIVTDMKGAIKKVASFLEKNMTEKQVEKLADHLYIDNFRKNTSVNRGYWYYIRNEDGAGLKRIRKGKVGDWKEYFTDELNSKANEWIEENYKKTDLRFPVDFK